MTGPMREEVQKICFEIIQNLNQDNTQEMTEKVELLYEKLLTASLLEQKQKRLSGLSERVAQSIKSDTTEMPNPKAQPEPETHKPITPGGEIKVVPIPEGPPKSNRHMDEPKREEPAKPAAPKPENTAEPVEARMEKSAVSKSSGHTTTRIEVERTRISATVQSKILRPLNIGLNDRIAFVKHLFNGSQEDLNRVTSQINTFDSYDQAEDFLLNTVQPDYNWEGKEEYVERFITLLKARYGVD